MWPSLLSRMWGADTCAGRILQAGLSFAGVEEEEDMNSERFRDFVEGPGSWLWFGVTILLVLALIIGWVFLLANYIALAVR